MKRQICFICLSEITVYTVIKKIFHRLIHIPFQHNSKGLRFRPWKATIFQHNHLNTGSLERNEYSQTIAQDAITNRCSTSLNNCKTDS